MSGYVFAGGIACRFSAEQAPRYGSEETGFLLELPAFGKRRGRYIVKPQRGGVPSHGT